MIKTNIPLIAFFCLLFSSILTWGSPSQVVDLQSTSGEQLRVLFEKANAAYEEGEYDDAIAKYESLVEYGVRHGDLFYNLGNAYFKIGELGRAILSYERALKLDPRDEDTKKNLSLTNLMIRDKQFMKKEVWIVKAAAELYRNLAINEAVVLSSLLYFLLCIMLAFFILLDAFPQLASIQRGISHISPGRLLGLSRKQDMVMALIFVFILFVGASTLSANKIVREMRRDLAVAVESEVPVHSAPSTNSTIQFKIHEGTRVKLRESRGGWIRIDLPGGLSGWIEKGTAERI